jgi:RNA polymerase subunit RPABC4/transcription elongation factor Spt4
LSVVGIIIPKFKILFNNRFELIIMVEEQEKCKFCGKSRFTQSTEQKNNVWASETICESCGRVVKTHTFKKRVNDTERK